jgi:hypothetical protein
MKQLAVLAILAGLFGSSLLAAAGSGLTGSYVEARTAEVFTGGCVMGGDAGTVGKEAVLAWKVNHGTFNGVSLDGLSVVAALAGTANLGIFEMGGERAVVRSSVFVDQRADPAQRTALVAMANDLSRGVMGSVVSVTAAPIQFADDAEQVRVAAGPVVLSVSKAVNHDPVCGGEQWFHPLAAVDDATLGMALQHSFNGPGLGVTWSDPDKHSAFFGAFHR